MGALPMVYQKQKLFAIIYIMHESIGKVENAGKHLIFFFVPNQQVIHDIQMGLLIEI